VKEGGQVWVAEFRDITPAVLFAEESVGKDKAG